MKVVTSFLIWFCEGFAGAAGPCLIAPSQSDEPHDKAPLGRVAKSGKRIA